MSGTTIEGPVVIPDEALAEPAFNHKSVRLRITKASAWKSDEDVMAFPVNFVLEAEQPDHTELEEFAGFELSRWFRLDSKSVKFYKEFCNAMGLDPQRPDFGTLVGRSVIAVVKTVAGTGKNAGETYHNVNAVQAA